MQIPKMEAEDLSGALSELVVYQKALPTRMTHDSPLALGVQAMHFIDLKL